MRFRHKVPWELFVPSDAKKRESERDVIVTTAQLAPLAVHTSVGVSMSTPTDVDERNCLSIPK